jgi:hypothetical protein
LIGHLQHPQDLEIDGLQVPRQFYIVFRDPAPLAGMAYPGTGMPWRKLYGLGFRGVVCLCGSRVEYGPAPLSLLQAVGMEDLHHGNDPVYPARNEKLVREAVDLINAHLLKGEGVAVHCVGGTGRTGTVIGCVLRSRGYTSDDVISYLEEINQLRGRRWPEAPWQADMVRRY